MSKGPQKSVHDLADRLVKAIRSTRKDNTDVPYFTVEVCYDGGNIDPGPTGLQLMIDFVWDELLKEIHRLAEGSFLCTVRAKGNYVILYFR